MNSDEVLVKCHPIKKILAPTNKEYAQINNGPIL